MDEKTLMWLAVAGALYVAHRATSISPPPPPQSKKPSANPADSSNPVEDTADTVEHVLTDGVEVFQQIKDALDGGSTTPTPGAPQADQINSDGGTIYG